MLLVAVAVFLIVGRNDIRNQERYAAQLRNTAANVAVKTGNPTVARAATNGVNQVRQKIKNVNL